jgi:AcrR family transcriptional regulator
VARPQLYSDETMFQGIHQALCGRGYAQLTLELIAKEIAVSPAALTKRFGSKKAMLLFYIDTVISRTEAAFEAVRSAPGSRLQALEALFVRTMGNMSNPAELANFTSLFIDSVGDPDLLARSQKRLEVIDTQIVMLLDEAVAAGELSACDTRQAARVLQSALAGAMLMWLGEPERTLADWVRDCFVMIIAPLHTNP